MTRAIDVVRKVAPQARANYLAAFEDGDDLLQQVGLATPDRMAHFLAQILHETGGLTLDRESMSYRADRIVAIFGVGKHSAAITAAEAQTLARDERALAERVYGLGNPKKAAELGNLNPGDGFRFRGGGLMQTTGRFNFRNTGRQCGVDFEARPELIVSPEHALKPALIEWSERELNAFADNNDILAISRAINCGSARSRKIPNGLQDRSTWFARIRFLIDKVDFKATAQTMGPSPTSPQAGPEDPLQPDTAGTQVIANLVGQRIFRLNAQGSTIRAVQRALAMLGYQLKGTGYFGVATQTAVMDFQKGHSLEPDGEIGPDTAKAIDRALGDVVEQAGKPVAPHPASTLSEDRPEPPPSVGIALEPSIAGTVGTRILRMGDQGPAVGAVQLALAKLGYDLKGTGYFGGATDTAVNNFQERHGLEVDGEVGPETAKAIDIALARPGGSAANGNPPQSLPASVADERPLWLIEGLKWVGTDERGGSGNNPEILDWAHDEGGSIAINYKSDSIPWCALYANMVLTKVGLKGTETLWALDWANWGQELPGPAVGAFVPMKRNGGGHIAIVVGRDQKGNLMCLGGNQDDAVNIKPFPKGRPLGFRWPKGTPMPPSTGINALPLVSSNGRTSAKES
jgi:uncharacterized protein (TIGR02594 family)